jgi:hypothetical protein
MAAQVESDRFHYLSLHENLHRRIAECARCEIALGGYRENACAGFPLDVRLAARVSEAGPDRSPFRRRRGSRHGRDAKTHSFEHDPRHGTAAAFISSSPKTRGTPRTRGTRKQLEAAVVS